MEPKLLNALTCVHLALREGSAPDRQGLITLSLSYGSRIKVTREEVEKVLDTPLAALAKLK